MISVDREECVGCGACVEVCPVGAISLLEGKAQVNGALCTDCGACLQVCSTGALSRVGEPVRVREAMPAPVIQVRPVPLGSAGPPAPAPKSGVWPFVGATLAFLGQRVAPRLATYFLDALGKRAGLVSGKGAGKGRRLRFRRRGRW